MPDRKYTEIRSKDLVHQHLITQCSFAPDSIEWEDGSEPPDYWLRLYGATRYAVEVTESAVKRNKIEERTFRKSVEDYTEMIERKAMSERILNGAYVLSFPEPISSKRVNAVKRELEPQILTYIRDTAPLESAECEKLFVCGDMICKVRKMHIRKDVIYPSPGGRAAYVDSLKNDEQILRLLQDAIDRKEKKLASVRDPKILVYCDTYLLSDEHNYHRCAGGVRTESFHTIFVVINCEKLLVLVGGNF